MSDKNCKRNQRLFLQQIVLVTPTLIFTYFFQVCVKESNTIRTNYAEYGNVKCSWLLGSYSGYIVVLEVSSLSFGACSRTCGCGQLEVFDTSMITQTKLGSWCSPPGKNIISKGHNMLVRFVSSPTSTRHNFRATYKYVRKPKGNI